MSKRALAAGPVKGQQAALRGVSRMATWLMVAATALVERNRQRRSLAELDDRLLRDIGLTRADARRECEKPRWRG